MSTCKVEFKGFNIDSSSLDNYLNQFTIDGKQKIENAKNTISYLLSNAEDNKLGVLKLALNSNKAYINDLANMMLNTNRKFYAEVEIDNNLKGFSKYNANDNRIYINVDAISQRFSESAEEYLYERIVHDFIQWFANRELKKALSDANRDSPHMRNIINLFKEYKNITDKKQYDLFKESIEREPMLDPRSERSLVREGYAEGTYRAMTNLAEFLSYGLSNSEFRNKLRKQNLWQKFVSWLKDLLGISQDNNDLEYLYKNLDSYLKQDDPYTLHSGGAIGADTVWGQIGKQFGISEENQRHYKTADMPNGNTQITEQDYKEGKKEAAKAANRMFGYDKTEVNMGLLIRNWSQVKYSDAVYAVGRLVPAGENAFPDNKKEDTRIAKNPTVTGGTGYAVNMAILNNKPVYVYNQYDHPTYHKGWYKYDSNINDYVPTETPTLTRHFAGIGTRYINEDGEKAIQDTYEKTFNKKQQTGSQSSTDSNIKVEQQNRYSVQDVRNNPDKIFVFGDNSIRQGTGGQAQIRNEPNAVGIMTKKFPRNTPDAFLYDSEYAENIKRINEDIENLKQKAKGKTVVFPTDGIGTNLADIAHTAPRTMEYLINRLREEFGLKDSDPFIKSMLNKLNEARNGFGQKMLIDGEIYSYNVDKLKAYKYTFVGSGINAKQNATEVTDPNLIKKISDKYFEIDRDSYEQKSGSEVNIYLGSNENKELSNLALRPFTYGDKKYYSVEHAYQTLKSGLFDEKVYSNPNWQKGDIKITSGKKPLTLDNYNITLMKALIKASFEQNKEALDTLLNTGNKKLTHKQDTGIWKEMFPKLLMEVRDELLELYNNTSTEEGGSIEGEEFQVDQFVFSYNPETGKYYQHFKSKKGEVKEFTNEKQQNKTFLKYIEKHPEHAEVVTYENTGNRYVYDKQRDKVISLSTADTIVQNDIVDKVKNHEEYEHKKEIERIKKIIKSNISSLNDIDMLELLYELRNKGYDIKDEVVYFEALLEIREDEKKEIHKKEEPIKKEEIAKEEKPKEESKPLYEHEFSYKGITIPTKFQLSEEQEQALITLIENITSGDPEPITLSGYAGTGKTSVIGYLEDYLKRKRSYKFLYGAPTHAATLYLGYNTKKMPFTIASSVVKRIDNFGNVTYITSSKVDQALSDYDQNIFVVDEVSLMDSTTMDNFLSVMDRKGVKVIFMGDKMQLPEVASKGKINPETKNPIKDVSKAFTDFKLIQLSQVQRTKDNAILRVLTEIRNNPDGVLPVVDNTETLQFFNKDDNTKGFYKGFRTAYEADPEEAIYITYTNEDVKNFNKSFRKAFYGEDVDGLVEGESVIGYSGYNNKKIKSNDLANSIKYTVDDISYDGSEVKITLKSNAIQKLADLHSQNRENDKTVQTTYLQMSRTDSLDMKNLTDKDFLKNNSKLSEIFRDVYDLKKMALGTNRWKDFSETLAKITGGLAKLEIGDDYFYNPYTNMMEKESSVNWSNPQMANLKKNYKELFMSKSIDYGYGITIHKAQGATYKNVFFNATSTEFAKTEIHENGMQISTEGNSLNYVAMSRASEKLFVLHSNNIKRLNNDDSIELSKNCSVF